MSSEPTRQEPVTLSQLLCLIRQDLSGDPCSNPKRVSARMQKLARTAHHLAQSLGKEQDTIKAGEVAGAHSKFQKYLEGLGLEEAPIAEHLGRLNTLLRFARELHCVPQIPALPLGWEPISQAVKKIPGASEIIKDALERNIPVSSYRDEDLEEWGARARAKRRSYRYVREVQIDFRRILRTTRLCTHFPLLNVGLRAQPSVRLRLDAMPPSLRKEIDEILVWMRREAQRGVMRLKESREPEVQACFEQFCGYAVHMKKMPPPTDLTSLLTKEYVGDYVAWCKDRGGKKRSIQSKLAPLDQALRFYPLLACLKREDLIRTATQSIVEEDLESTHVLGKRTHAIDHSELERITDELHQKRLISVNLGDEERAWLCHDELLMLFSTWYPWYPGCLRSCRFKGPWPNLFKGPVYVNDRPFALTPSAKAKLEANPSEALWQFSFSAKETRNGYPVRGLMPDGRFVDLLNEYEEVHHPYLTKNSGAVTLFLNRAGRPLTGQVLLSRLSNLIGKPNRVTPTACRDSFACYWLEKFPDQYENLAVILWTSVGSVVKQYGTEEAKEKYLKHW